MTKTRVRQQIRFFTSSIRSPKTPKHLKLGLKKRVKVLQRLLRSKEKK